MRALNGGGEVVEQRWPQENYNVLVFSFVFLEVELVISPYKATANVFGHRTMKVSHPVRSAVNKHRIAWLVLQWVTMWESQVLNSD